MAKADQEAHRGKGLQSAGKSLPAGHEQSKETYALHDLSADRQDRQIGISIDTQHNTLDFGAVRDRVEEKRAVDFVNVVYHLPRPHPTDTRLLPDEKWRQEIRASQQIENTAVAVRATPLVERRPPDGGKVAPLVEARQLQQREDFATRALHVWQERQTHRDGGNTLMQQGANALGVARHQPGKEVWQPPTALALARGASEQTKDRRDKKSRAEDRVLKAIRSKADSDGKNARVGYENLAAMTEFSRRHVIRVVNSLIYERGMLRVEKRVMKPGHNAINVYHVVSRDVTDSEKGIGVKTGKTGQTETTRVTEPVTPAKPRPIPALTHAPLSSAFVTEKPASPSLTDGSKPRYFSQELTPG
jgi:hypothetical protein